MPETINTHIKNQTTQYKFSSFQVNINKLTLNGCNIGNQRNILIKIQVYYSHEWKDT